MTNIRYAAIFTTKWFCMAELCDLLFQANWPEAKQQPSMFGSCLRVNLAMTGSCAADQKLNSVHLMCNCALFNAYQCIVRWDRSRWVIDTAGITSVHVARFSRISTRWWLGRFGSYWTTQKLKVIFVSIKMCLLIFQGIKFFFAK